ncbi:hypothetical protein DLM75_07180 [Leptospira stimsonii]|uniref:Uncharacterized protein n=1 Tax=Leptospira stimsonii TaxID=2202203 RepID=A0A396ZGQ4_9LEPT|nr:hypothetical protein DLM75_07180 [Leptospira stimsonii]
MSFFLEEPWRIKDKIVFVFSFGIAFSLPTGSFFRRFISFEFSDGFGKFFEKIKLFSRFCLSPHYFY